MPEKIDAGAVAQEAHKRNIESRQDGGQGSGPKKGGGRGSGANEGFQKRLQETRAARIKEKSFGETKGRIAEAFKKISTKRKK